MRMPILSICFALVLPGAGYGLDYAVGDLTVVRPVAKSTNATAMTSAGYFSITNTGTVGDTLLGISADFPRVELHDMVMDGDVAKMVKLEAGVDIAPGETLTFAPGGKHVMFMGLNGDPFEVGEEIPATMTFENAGTVEIVFHVEEIVADDGHSGH